jgi:hypothetical protein
VSWIVDNSAMKGRAGARPEGALRAQRACAHERSARQQAGDGSARGIEHVRTGSDAPQHALLGDRQGHRRGGVKECGVRVFTNSEHSELHSLWASRLAWGKGRFNNFEFGDIGGEALPNKLRCLRRRRQKLQQLLAKLQGEQTQLRAEDGAPAQPHDPFLQVINFPLFL